MGRRSDHSRGELEEMILSAGHALMAEQGFARFSAREVAKRIGYSVGTLYNVFGSADALVLAINTRTFAAWAEHLRAALAEAGDDRIRALVAGYFAFARANPNLWMAIYDHRLPPGMAMPERDAAARGVLTGIVADEVAAALGTLPGERSVALARSLIATVHGHCAFDLTGSFALMGEGAPMEAALARVRESLAAARD
ncbi:TetR/AcrR family transcriptional regulator [Sphingomonas donggukensis]|uniref:TetR/AcrR family transcriptional regulator n=1 Tax=Sphingomonas donggukensis TaxID=2949093 RepID=A0ABY4TT80_9SPHN|nr:TetR/AcrR family transcriptional regulator [Sphingomonas donggukensis]URW75487.1 TetR/AcrR family transcriptional regulator [Sphingomonas donggukensis]